MAVGSQSGSRGPCHRMGRSLCLAWLRPPRRSQQDQKWLLNAALSSPISEEMPHWCCCFEVQNFKFSCLHIWKFLLVNVVAFVQYRAIGIKQLIPSIASPTQGDDFNPMFFYDWLT